MQGNNYQIDKEPLLNIPILEPSYDIQKPIIELVDKILISKKDDMQADTSKYECEIDRIVYELYGLTDEEIAVVEEEG